MKLTIIGSVDEIKRFLGGDVSAKVTVDGAESKPKLTRADVVAQAKRDVDVLSDRMMDKDMDVNEGNDVFRYLMTFPKFIANREKRTVVALVKDTIGVTHARGIVKCAPDDVFNADIGKAIALRRALGLDVPDEYLNAPKPEGVAVGDIVQATDYDMFVDTPYKVDKVENGYAYDKPGKGWIPLKYVKVIDDTDREEYRSVGV